MAISRRKFIEMAAAAGGMSGLSGCGSQRHSESVSTVSGITVEALERAAQEPVLQCRDITSPVIIESIQLLRKGNDYLVHVRSQDGAEGIAIPNSRVGNLYPIFNNRVAPYFIGKDARDLEEHLWGVYRFGSNYKLQGVALWCCVAWIEFAILDLLGRISNRSIARLLGGVVREKVPFYVASGHRDNSPQEEVEWFQGVIEKTGARAIKFRAGGRMSRNADSRPGRTEGLIRLSRQVLGDEIDIHADANSSYDPPRAIEIGKMLEDINAVYFEEPCPFDHLEDTKRVTEALTIPVAGGEQEFSQRRFRWTILNHGVDIVQPDLQYYGGLIRSKRVARMAALVGMPTTVHISGGFGFVYMLHFAACTPDIGRYQEFKQGMDRIASWFDPPLTSQAGALSIPTGPGVGIRDISALLKGATSFPA